MLGKRQILTRMLMMIFSLFPINKKKIVVESYYGKGYGDNGKYIIEELIKKSKSYRIIWLISKNSKYDNVFPPYVSTVQIDSLRSLYHLSTAKVWIDNCRKSIGVRKRANQFYIQTWHGAMGFKYCEKDAEESLNPEYILNCKHDSAMANVILSGSKWDTELKKRAFWLSGRILEVGSPRNDLLFCQDRNLVKNIQSRLKTGSKKIVLYAPTFRNNHSLEAYKLDFDRITQALSDKFGKSFVLLLRLHPNISDQKNDLCLPSDVVDVTDYPDMQELLLVSDVLITDYSSSAFEFIFTKKPIFLIGSDYDSFIKQDRKLYFDLNNLPFSFSKTLDDLLYRIKHFNYQEYIQKIDKFLEDVGSVEKGTASKEVVELIQEVTTNGDRNEY